MTILGKRTIDKIPPYLKNYREFYIFYELTVCLLNCIANNMRGNFWSYNALHSLRFSLNSRLLAKWLQYISRAKESMICLCNMINMLGSYDGLFRSPHKANAALLRISLRSDLTISRRGSLRLCSQMATQRVGKRNLRI
jgi:hypothetical protein